MCMHYAGKFVGRYGETVVCWHAQAVTTTTPVMPEMVSPLPVSQTDQADIRYRQTVTVSGPSEPEPAIEATSAAQVAAAPLTTHRDDVTAAATETPQQPQQQQQQQDVDRSQQFVDAVMRILNWDNDIRRDPFITVIVITVLFL